MTAEEVGKLPDDELRVRVAELRGWRSCYLKDTIDFVMCAPDETWCDDPRWIVGKPSKTAKLSGANRPPNYPGDHNAMHEAEKTLSEDQRICYESALLFSVKESDIVYATSRQRAEAFVITMQ